MGDQEISHSLDFVYAWFLSDMVPVRGSPAPMTTKPEWFFFCGLAWSGISIAGPGGMNRSSTEI